MTAPSLHHRAIKLSCPDWHITSTQAASGQQIRCGGCTLAGCIVLLTVPERADDELIDESTLGRPPARCRICRKPGSPGGRTPVGWITIQIQADPVADPKGRSQRILWPYCSPNCAIAALEKANSRAPKPNPDEYMSLGALMREPPAGRYGEST